MDMELALTRQEIHTQFCLGDLLESVSVEDIEGFWVITIKWIFGK